jgi:hypothetical protein
MKRIRLWPRPATGWGRALICSALWIAATFLVLAIVGRLSALAGCSASDVGRCEYQLGSIDAGGILNTLAILGFGSFFFLVPVACAVGVVSALVCVIKRKW